MNDCQKQQVKPEKFWKLWNLEHLPNLGPLHKKTSYVKIAFLEYTGALRSVLLLSFCVVLHSSRSPFLSFFPGHLKGFPAGVQTSERYVNSTRTVVYYVLEVNVSSLAEYTRPTEIISRTRAGILSSVLKRNPSKMLAAISPHQFHENSFVEELNLHRQRSRVDSTSIEKTKDADINGQ